MMTIETVRSARTTEGRRLGAGFAILVLLIAFEVVGAIRAGSTALLGDAGHVLMDVLAMGGSFMAARIARRRPTMVFTFGFSRMEIIAAFVNGLLLLGIAISIGALGVARLAQPHPVHGGELLFFASIGLVANLVCMWILKGARHGSLNMQSAFWHVLGDTLSSVLVVANAILIAHTGSPVFDPVASILIAGILAVGSVRLIGRAGKVLLEASEIDVASVEAAIRAVHGVESVHHIHVRTLTDGVTSLTARVHPVGDPRLSECAPLVESIERVLHERFGIRHVTIQLEAPHGERALECVFEEGDRGG